MRVAAVVFDPVPENLSPIADAFLRFSPQLCLKRPGTIFIEIGKCRALYREETFLKRLQILLKRFHLHAHVAIGNTLLESLLLVLYGHLDYQNLSTACFFDVLDPFQADESLRTNVERIIDNLNPLGIKTVEQFLKLPTVELPARFGAIGLCLRSRLLNEIDIGWPLWKPEEKIIEKLELFGSTQCAELEPLLFYLQPLLERAFTRLWGRGLRASSLCLKLNLETYSIVKEPCREWRLEFILPQTTARGTLPIIRERLERDLIKKPLESCVLSMDLEILQTVQDYQGQRHFFHSRESVEEAFHSVLAQLAEGLGKDKVFRANIHEEAVAEKSWSKVFSEQKIFPDLSDYIPLRPTKLLHRPERIQLVKDMIFIRKRQYRIVKWSAVEHIATHWIDQEIVRSYYRLILEGKSPVWVFKNSKGDYYLHGYFG